MKLRLRENSLRLRLNRRDVHRLASGNALEARLLFPGGGRLSYALEPNSGGAATACFDGSAIRITVPYSTATEWAASENLGLYFDFAATEEPLKVAIEKDLECLHGPEEEQDPEAFPRA